MKKMRDRRLRDAHDLRLPKKPPTYAEDVPHTDEIASHRSIHQVNRYRQTVVRVRPMRLNL